MAHLEVLVEEPSMRQLLEVLLPTLLSGSTFDVRQFSGKSDILAKLPSRLQGYSSWIDTRVLVLLDRDDEDCIALKLRLNEIVANSSLGLASVGSDTRGEVMNRIVIEELESWYFGDVEAICNAYPRVPATLGQKAAFRDPDAIKGGTWEALERVLQASGYHRGGLRKIGAAADIAKHMDVDRNTSRSFQHFRDGVRALCGVS
jgi:hypothetical protein